MRLSPRRFHPRPSEDPGGLGCAKAGSVVRFDRTADFRVEMPQTSTTEVFATLALHFDHLLLLRCTKGIWARVTAVKGRIERNTRDAK